LNVFSEPRTNQLIVVGPSDLVAEAMELIKRFDVSLDLQTRVYRLTHVQAERFNRIIEGFLAGQKDSRLYNSSVDEEGNLLIASATEDIHRHIDELSKQIDVPVEAAASPLRFYKLKNANVLDVLYSLQALQEVSDSTTIVEGFSVQATGAQPLMQGAPIGGGMNREDGAATPPVLRRPGDSSSVRMPGEGLDTSRLPLPPNRDIGPVERMQDARFDRLSTLGSNPYAAMTTLPGGARVSADVATNSLIIVAPPEAQAMYANLIESLDQRRPQVMIEAKIIAVDTSDDFELGVELSSGDRSGLKRLFAFSSYGLSLVDPVTGALQIIPGTGFNGTLVDPEVADAVVKALANHSRARVLASPRILVNDNSTGQLESVLSVPFESVNASNTVATTSLGGNQQAGTVITVTPHINEEDHLLLEFAVEFSTFTSAGSTSDVLPPPRQIDKVESMVTIPDGQTVIVGGLNRIGEVNTLTSIPYLELVPVVRDLTSLQGGDLTTTSFFLFIRPLILRDDKFTDLKFLSKKSHRCAEIPGDYPTSQPIMIE
jgi:type II secretory pathway component GspD/PulD (secretin)